MFLLIEKLICQLPNYIVCSSNSNKDFIVNEMKIPESKVSELIDGIYTNYFKEKNYTELKKSLGIDKEKIIIYSGSLLPSKGINYLVEAIPKIINLYSNLKFLIIGYPIEIVKAKVEELRIEKSLIFLNRVDFFKLPEYLSIADIAVDPKVDKAGEGSGKIVNYMGAGLPIVCFESLNNKNFLGESGIFAEPANSEDLADKILLLLNDGNKCKELGILNKKRANDMFSWNVKGKRLLDIYNYLLS
jgi:glycosyltransferase involved in cell wall biosynthesis